MFLILCTWPQSIPKYTRQSPQSRDSDGVQEGVTLLQTAALQSATAGEAQIEQRGRLSRHFSRTIMDPYQHQIDASPPWKATSRAPKDLRAGKTPHLHCDRAAMPCNSALHPRDRRMPSSTICTHERSQGKHPPQSSGKTGLLRAAARCHDAPHVSSLA